MRTEDGPKGRATKRFSAAREAAAAREPAASVTVAPAEMAVGGATVAGGETVAGGAAVAGGETPAHETRGAHGGVGTVGSGPPEIVFEPDPETRNRIQMAAESDLEASRYAHWRGTVTFHDVANAWFNMSDPNLTPELRAEFKTIFPGLLDAFAEPRKGIITAYFCRHIRVAAALTDIGHAAGAPEGVPEATLKGPPPAGIKALLPAADSNGHGDPIARDDTERAKRPRRNFLRTCLHLFDPAPASSSAIHIEPTFGDPADWKAKEILFHCMNLHYKALEFLTPQPRKICMRMIFGVIATLLGTLDARALNKQLDRPFGSDPTEVATLERELAQAQAYYRASAQRQAQLEYLLGMLTAIIPAAAITAIIAITAGLLDKPATVAVLGGAIGAVVSVMSRMSSGSIELKPESGKKTIRALGFMRPVIGGIFGAVVYVFLAGGIVEIVTPPTGTGELAFYGGLGFLSGFSERFANDVIAQGASKTPPLPDTARSPARQ
ncbi:MAG TPA: hypothetical protein VFX51_13085 [Solirubrobacteraceae bacterium]|nr:hypothetical protein [Solirubrobacteraceae bacterium]